MYDLIILGAGPAGVTAAQEAIKNHLSVLLIDENKLGGTCLNRGCIPTKYFIKNFTAAANAQDIVSAKDKLVSAISGALHKKLIKDGVAILNAHASLKDENTVEVDSKEYKAKNIIIATGSHARKLSIEGRDCLSPEALLSSDFSATNYLIVGGGVIGLEYAFLLRQLNKNVTIVEQEDSILNGFDKDIVLKLEQLLKRNKIKLYCGSKAQEIKYHDYDCIVAAIGRKANFASIGLEKVDIDNRNGWIERDECLRTSKKNIYACGDIAGDKLFAYTAEHEAKYIVSHILGKQEKYIRGPVPQCIYGQISLASVGAREEELIAASTKYEKIVKNFISYPAAHVYDDKQGMIKVLYDNNGAILGAHIVSKYAVELISNFTLAIANNITVTKLADTLYLHPSMSEIIAKIWE